ncbi:MAG: hypothetical protein JJ975_14175 [Bacteroidia bacterium]|nr:hypothetical protein [Bacteroidia bacterium]
MIASSCGARKKARFENNLALLDIVSIADFGAIPNDNKDDSKAIQSAIDFVIHNKKSSHLYCPPGVYNLEEGLVVGNQQPNGEYFFTTITISGHISTYSPDQRIGSTTVFKMRNPTFGIAFQLARNCVVENIVFEGCAQYTNNIETILTASLEDWGEAARARTNSNSPSCAIAIDPFHREITSQNRYPGMEQYYKNQGSGGSSMVLIRGCSFSKHYIAVANNASGKVANGDNIRVEQCNVSTCHTFWSAGQTQSRANSIDNVYAMFLHTFISGMEIGSRHGTPPAVRNLNLAGFCKQLLEVNSGFASVNFSQSYMESLWTLGLAIADQVSFSQCKIKFEVPGNKHFAPPCYLYAKGVASFRDCDLQFFNNCKTRMPILLHSQQLLISGGSVEGGVVVADGHTNAGGEDLHNVKMESVFIKCLNKVAGASASTKPNSNLKGDIIMGGDFVQGLDGSVYRSSATTYNLYQLEDVKVVINESSKTGSFTTSNPGYYKIGDNLFTNRDVDIKQSGYALSIKLRSPLGYVGKIEGSKITVYGVPHSFPQGQTRLYCAAYPRVCSTVIGKTKVGSSIISNVDFASLNWIPVPGDRINNNAFHQGSYVVHVDRKMGLVRMSSNAKNPEKRRTTGLVKYKPE